VGDIIGECVVGRVVLHVCGRGGLALCAMSVFLPFWLVYPIKESIVSTSMLFEPGWISIPWEYFDGESRSSRSLSHVTR
jgi:hypothetical protein